MSLNDTHMEEIWKSFLYIKFAFSFIIIIYLFLFLKNQHLIMLLFQPTTIISPLEFMIV